jgi:hypothetical protein
MKRTLLGLSLGALALTALLRPAPAQDPALRLLLDERAVARVADTLDHAVDTKDWALARAQFADRLVLDARSIGGPAGVELAADDLVAGWRTAFQGDKTALHLRTNHLARIEGDRAVLTSHGYAWNRLPEGVLPGTSGPQLWEVWGVYEHRMLREGGAWRITHFTFRATHERGPREVLTTVLPAR